MLAGEIDAGGDEEGE